jgi:hypothetical protein
MLKLLFSIILVTISSFGITGSDQAPADVLQLRDGKGNPLLVNVQGLGQTSSIPVSLAGKQNIKIVMIGDDTKETQTGWAKLVYNGKEYYFPQVAVGGLLGSSIYRSVFEISKNGSEIVPMLRYESYTDPASDPVSIATVLPADLRNSALITTERLAGERTDTGYAFLNKDLNNAHNFLFTFYNDSGSILEEKMVILQPGEQIAEFAYQRSNTITEGFSQVQITSDASFPAVSIDCRGPSISVRQVSQGNMPAGSPVYSFSDMQGNGTLDPSKVYPVTGGQVILKSTKDGTEYRYNISSEGFSDVLSTDKTFHQLLGEYLVRVEAPGFLTQEQLADFPAQPYQDKLINLKYINPDWFHKTTSPFTDTAKGIDYRGTIMKPAKQWKFYVDTTNLMLDDPTSPWVPIRDAFKQLVFYEFPQMRLEVPDDSGNKVIFGGKLDSKGDPIVNDPNSNYFEVSTSSIPPYGTDNTFPIGRNDSAIYPVTASTYTDLKKSEIKSGWIQFWGKAAPQSVAGDFWYPIFARDDQDLDARNFMISGLPNATQKLTGYFTQLAGAVGNAVSTPIDKYYWEIYRVRPNGTQIFADKEVVPKGKR